MGAGVPLVIAALAIAATVLLLVLAVVAPAPLSLSAALPPPGDDRPRLRLLSRVLFARRRPGAITLDCLLVGLEQASPDPSLPEGLPFTLEFQAPESAWFADRVEQLLRQWAAEDRELLFELTEEHPGQVHTTIASGTSRVHLELVGAAGLPGPTPPA